MNIRKNLKLLDDTKKAHLCTFARTCQYVMFVVNTQIDRPPTHALTIIAHTSKRQLRTTLYRLKFQFNNVIFISVIFCILIIQLVPFLFRILTSPNVILTVLTHHGANHLLKVSPNNFQHGPHLITHSYYQAPFA